MNKKIKIYTSLLIVTLITLMLTSTFHYNQYSSYRIDGEECELSLEDLPKEFGSVDSIEGGWSATFYPTYDLDCYVRAQRFPQDKVLLSRYKKYPTQAEADVYKIEMQKVKVSIPMDKADSTVSYIVGFIWTVAFLLYAWLLVIIIKQILNIRRGEVFVSNVSKSIEKIGILLAVIYLFDLLCGYLLYSYFISNLHIAQYDIIFASSANEMFLIMGLVLMILSQIILMGKEMKEEQELTI